MSNSVLIESVDKFLRTEVFEGIRNGDIMFGVLSLCFFILIGYTMYAMYAIWRKAGRL